MTLWTRQEVEKLEAMLPNLVQVSINKQVLIKLQEEIPTRSLAAIKDKLHHMRSDERYCEEEVKKRTGFTIHHRFHLSSYDPVPRMLKHVTPYAGLIFNLLMENQHVDAQLAQDICTGRGHDSIRHRLGQCRPEGSGVGEFLRRDEGDVQAGEEALCGSGEGVLS